MRRFLVDLKRMSFSRGATSDGDDDDDDDDGRTNECVGRVCSIDRSALRGGQNMCLKHVEYMYLEQLQLLILE